VDYGQAYGGVQTQSAYAPATNAARIVVRLPADAQLWVDDYQSNQTGPVRQLNTPASLEPGRAYHYTLKAQWNQNGQPVTQERTVSFQAGQSVDVDFNQPAATTAEPIAPPATPPATTPPATNPPATTPPADTPPANPTPPATTPPASAPPAPPPPATPNP
jgi:uncharacterized protein (TIGR03000 family)